MVDVGVSDHHSVNVAGVEIQFTVVTFIPALLQTTVHQDLSAAALYTVATPRHRFSSTEKGQFHKAPPYDIYQFLLYCRKAVL